MRKRVNKFLYQIIPIRMDDPNLGKGVTDEDRERIHKRLEKTRKPAKPLQPGEDKYSEALSKIDEKYREPLRRILENRDRRQAQMEKDGGEE